MELEICSSENETSERRSLRSRVSTGHFKEKRKCKIRVDENNRSIEELYKKPVSIKLKSTFLETIYEQPKNPTEFSKFMTATKYKRVCTMADYYCPSKLKVNARKERVKKLKRLGVKIPTGDKVTLEQVQAALENIIDSDEEISFNIVKTNHNNTSLLTVTPKRGIVLPTPDVPIVSGPFIVPDDSYVEKEIKSCDDSLLKCLYSDICFSFYDENTDKNSVSKTRKGRRSGRLKDFNNSLLTAKLTTSPKSDPLLDCNVAELKEPISPSPIFSKKVCAKLEKEEQDELPAKKKKTCNHDKSKSGSSAPPCLACVDCTKDGTELTKTFNSLSVKRCSPGSESFLRKESICDSFSREEHKLLQNPLTDCINDSTPKRALLRLRRSERIRRKSGVFQPLYSRKNESAHDGSPVDSSCVKDLQSGFSSEETFPNSRVSRGDCKLTISQNRETQHLKNRRIRPRPDRSFSNHYDIEKSSSTQKKTKKLSKNNNVSHNSRKASSENTSPTTLMSKLTLTSPQTCVVTSSMSNKKAIDKITYNSRRKTASALPPSEARSSGRIFKKKGSIAKIENFTKDNDSDEETEISFKCYENLTHNESFKATAMDKKFMDQISEHLEENKETNTELAMTSNKNHTANIEKSCSSTKNTIAIVTRSKLRQEVKSGVSCTENIHIVAATNEKSIQCPSGKRRKKAKCRTQSESADISPVNLLQNTATDSSDDEQNNNKSCKENLDNIAIPEKKLTNELCSNISSPCSTFLDHSVVSEQPFTANMKENNSGDPSSELNFTEVSRKIDPHFTGHSDFKDESVSKRKRLKCQDDFSYDLLMPSESNLLLPEFICPDDEKVKTSSLFKCHKFRYSTSSHPALGNDYSDGAVNRRASSSGGIEKLSLIGENSNCIINPNENKKEFVKLLNKTQGKKTCFSVHPALASSDSFSSNSFSGKSLKPKAEVQTFVNMLTKKLNFVKLSSDNPSSAGIPPIKQPSISAPVSPASKFVTNSDTSPLCRSPFSGIRGKTKVKLHSLSEQDAVFDSPSPVIERTHSENSSTSLHLGSLLFKPGNEYMPPTVRPSKLIFPAVSPRSNVLRRTLDTFSRISNSLPSLVTSGEYSSKMKPATSPKRENVATTNPITSSVNEINECYSIDTQQKTGEVTAKSLSSESYLLPVSKKDDLEKHCAENTNITEQLKLNADSPLVSGMFNSRTFIRMGKIYTNKARFE